MPIDDQASPDRGRPVAAGTRLGMAIKLILLFIVLAGAVSLIRSGGTEEAIRVRLDTAAELMAGDTYTGYTSASGELAKILRWGGDHPKAVVRSAVVEALLYDGIDPDPARRERAGEIVGGLSGEMSRDPELRHLKFILGDEETRSGIAGEILREIEDGEHDGPTLRYLVARHLFAAGENEAALDHLRKALEMRPEDTLMTVALARKLAALGRHDEALPHFEGVREQHPAHGRAQVGATRAAMALGHDAEDLLEELRVVEEEHGASLSKHERLGIELAVAKLLVRQGALEAAMERLEEAIDSHESAPEPRALLGKLLFSRFELEAAEEAVLSAIRLGDDPAARRLHARVLIEWGRYEEALEAADAIEETTAADLITKGIAAYHLGRHREAAVALTRAVEAGVEEIEAVAHLALSHLGAGNERAARHVLLRAEALGDEPDALLSWAWARRHSSRGNHRLAQQHLSKAVEANPRAYRALVDMASLESGKRRHEEAASLLDAALDANPVFRDALLARGEASLALGDAEDAIRWYRRILDHDALEPRANGGLALALLELGDLDSARLHAETAVEQGRNEAVAHYGLGRVLLAENRPDDAVGAFVLARRRSPGDTRILVDLAKAHLARGEATDPEHARRYLEQALLKDSRDESARALLAGIDGR